MLGRRPDIVTWNLFFWQTCRWGLVKQKLTRCSELLVHRALIIHLQPMFTAVFVAGEGPRQLSQQGTLGSVLPSPMAAHPRSPEFLLLQGFASLPLVLALLIFITSHHIWIHGPLTHAQIHRGASSIARALNSSRRHVEHIPFLEGSQDKLPTAGHTNGGSPSHGSAFWFACCWSNCYSGHWYVVFLLCLPFYLFFKSALFKHRG